MAASASDAACPWILAHARVSRHIAEYCRAFMAGWDAWPASLPRLVWDTEPIAVAKTEVIAELARAYGTAPPLLGLFSANGTTLPDFIHPPTDVEIRFSTPAMPQGRWVEQAWRCVFALEMPETLLLMLHPSAPPLNEGCWDDLLSTLLRSQVSARQTADLAVAAVGRDRGTDTQYRLCHERGPLRSP